MTQNAPASAIANAAGSPPLGEPAFLAVGKLRRPHGVRGEILMEVYTDFPERLQPGIQLFLGEAASYLTLLKIRTHREGLLLSFEGYTTPEAVGQLRNRILYVRRDDRPPLADGEYYHHQLIGLHVVDQAGGLVGTVVEILETGANDVLVVRPAIGVEVLIPYTDSFVKVIDLEKQSISVNIIPGMRAKEA